MILIPRNFKGYYDLHVEEKPNCISFTVRGIDPEKDNEEKIVTCYLSREAVKVLCKQLIILIDG